MKMVKFFVCTTLMVAVPIIATAQKAIEEAFHDIEERNGIKVSVSNSHNTSNGIHSRTKILELLVGKDYFDVFDEIKSAFQCESEKAYFEWSSFDPISENNTRSGFRIQRGIGDDIIVGREKKSSFVIMSFEDTDNNSCRTVYAAEWWETDDPRIRQGRLICSYGEKPKSQTTVSRSYSFRIPKGMDIDSLLPNYGMITDSLLVKGWPFSKHQVDSLMENFPESFGDFNLNGHLNGDVSGSFPDDSFFFGKKYSDVTVEDNINGWVVNAQKRINKLSPSDWLRLFGLLTEKISSVKGDDSRELIVTAGVVLDLCKNVPAKLDFEERELCVRRLRKIAKKIEQNHEYVFDILMLASEKLEEG